MKSVYSFYPWRENIDICFGFGFSLMAESWFTIPQQQGLSFQQLDSVGREEGREEGEIKEFSFASKTDGAMSVLVILQPLIS